MKAIALAPLSLVLAFGAAAGAAPTKEQCIQADTDAQTLRMYGKLRQAREKLAVCVDPACPAMVRDDCTQRVDELQKVQPTVVFQVKDSRGDDLSDVSVTMDGVPIAQRLLGTALAVDTGPHKFAFESPGRARVEKTLLVREGEKDRLERIVLPPAGATPPPPQPQPTPPGAPASPEVPEVPPPATADTPTPAAATAGTGTNASASDGSSQRMLGLVAGGVGAAGVVVGGIFGVMTMSAWSSSKNECSGSTTATCPNHAGAVSDHDAAVSDGLVSTIAFVAGGAALAAGAVLYFTAPRASSPAVGVRVVPSVGPGGGGAVVVGTF